MAVSVDVVDELVQHHGRQSGHAGEETIDPRRRGQPGERRREVVTIGGPQPPQGRTATPLCTAGGGGWGTHTPVGTNARAPAPGGLTAHVVVETFRRSPNPDWSSAAVPAWYTHRVTWPRTAAPLARRTLTLTPAHHGGHPLVGSRTAAVANRAGTRPSTLEGYLPAGDRTPPDCQVDHGTFQSPYPSQDGIGVPPVLV